MSLIRKRGKSLTIVPFGHAIESLTDYKIPHGIAVSFGMDMANFISVKMKLLDNNIRKEVRAFLKKSGTVSVLKI